MPIRKKSPFLFILISTFIFVLLFYRQSIGLNLLLFETVVLLLLEYKQRTDIRNLNAVTMLAGTVITAIWVVLHHSILSILVNFISLALLTGMKCYPESRSLITAAALAFFNIVESMSAFLSNLKKARFGFFRGHYLWKLMKVVVLPLLIVWIFAWMYKNANFHFKQFYDVFWSKIDILWSFFGKFMHFDLILVIFLGGWISVYLFMCSPSSQVIRVDKNKEEMLTRRKNRRMSFVFPDLNYELRSGLVLLLLLNLLILLVNVLDIYWVWFNFEWEGQYLKQFVHEGTYLLLFSILISIAVVLYFFRGNLNFHPGNRMLKILAAAWLTQNAVLAISVVIRNMWYIQYFALAYKRIAVLFFLGLILFGLVTVWIKVSRGRSAYYLFRVNSYALYMVLFVASLFNWDVIITKYNFSHYRTAFVHLNYLVRVSDKALPYADKSMEELKAIESSQDRLFQFEERYMNIETYHDRIEVRKQLFLNRYPNRSILSWNYADFAAYVKLNLENGK